MEKRIGSTGWVPQSKEAKMFQKSTLNTYNPFVIVIGISLLGLLVILFSVARISPAGVAGSSDRGVAREAAVGSQAAYISEHGSLVKLTGDTEPVARFEGSIAALTGQLEGSAKPSVAAWMKESPKDFGAIVRVTGEISAAPRYEGSLAALTGQMSSAPRYEGSLAALTGQFWATARYEGSLAALTGQMEPVARYEGSLAELTGAGRSASAHRMSQSEFEQEFGPIVSITG